MFIYYYYYILLEKFELELPNYIIIIVFLPWLCVWYGAQKMGILLSIKLKFFVNI